jgi:hypothetical protein
VDPRAGLDDIEERKFITLRDSNLISSDVELVASSYTDCATI